MGEFYNLHFSKKEGVEAMLKYYNKDASSLIFFGDGENDIALLRMAGIGVAMGNACDTAKKAADYVTLTNDEDGVADYIERVLLRV